MPTQAKGIHHLHLRRRIHLKKQTYPSKKPLLRFFDNIAYAAGVLTPAFTLPQLYEIYAHHDASGVSLITWSAYLVLSIFWMLYGIVHKEKPIILMYFSQAFLQIFIVWGIVIY